MNLLKQYRKKEGYTFEEMSNLLDISKTYYWQIENGKRRLSYIMAVKIAVIFNLKPDDLFFDEIIKEVLK